MFSCSAYATILCLNSSARDNFLEEEKPTNRLQDGHGVEQGDSQGQPQNRFLTPRITTDPFPRQGWTLVGDEVGDEVGDDVGDDVGRLVDDEVGDDVGDNVGDDVGDEVGPVQISFTIKHPRNLAARTNRRRPLFELHLLHRAGKDDL